MTLTDEQKKLLAYYTNLIKQFAREAMQVEFITDNIYIFGSELACLRLGNKVMGRVDYSPNLKSWYWSKE
jgi:hypothetical protein